MHLKSPESVVCNILSDMALRKCHCVVANTKKQIIQKYNPREHQDRPYKRLAGNGRIRSRGHYVNNSLVQKRSEYVGQNYCSTVCDEACNSALWILYDVRPVVF